MFEYIGFVKLNESMVLPKKGSILLFYLEYTFKDPVMLSILDTHNRLLNINRIQTVHFGSVKIGNFIIIVSNILE